MGENRAAMRTPRELEYKAALHRKPCLQIYERRIFLKCQEDGEAFSVEQCILLKGVATFASAKNSVLELPLFAEKFLNST